MSPMHAVVSRAGARTGLQLQGHGDMQGLNSSSAAKRILDSQHAYFGGNRFPSTTQEIPLIQSVDGRARCKVI